MNQSSFILHPSYFILPMKLSAKTEYACLAVLELAARHNSGEPVRIKSIADEHGIPARFLVQILLQLKGAGFVISTRGASGGYQLAKPPEEITLDEVMTIIEGPETEFKSSVASRSPTTRVLTNAWREIAKVEHDMLHSITFGGLVERLKRQTENMYYI